MEEEIKVVRDEKSFAVVTPEHCYFATPEEVVEHDAFIKKHENCPCLPGQSKFEYYENGSGYGSLFSVLVACRSCGEAHVICVDEW